MPSPFVSAYKSGIRTSGTPMDFSVANRPSTSTILVVVFRTRLSILRSAISPISGGLTNLVVFLTSQTATPLKTPGTLTGTANPLLAFTFPSKHQAGDECRSGDQAGGRAEFGALTGAVGVPAPRHQRDDAEQVGQCCDESGLHIGQTETFDDLRQEQHQTVTGDVLTKIDQCQRPDARITQRLRQFVVPDRLALRPLGG